MKICGILIENAIRSQAIDSSIVGIGLNVNQTAFADDRATSVKDMLGYDVDRTDVLNTLLRNIEARYLMLKNGAFDEMRRDYLQSLYWKDESHLFEAFGEEFVGTIVGVDPTGKLEVSRGQELLIFDFKEVKYLR